MARINIELADADKDRFQEETDRLDSSMTAELVEFITQWYPQQENANDPLPKFFVVCVDEELHHRVSDKVQEDGTSVQQVLTESLERWASH